MKLFVDTAKIEDIKKAEAMGVICGVTTNPSLIAKEGGRSQEDVLKEIASIVVDANLVITCGCWSCLFLLLCSFLCA